MRTGTGSWLGRAALAALVVVTGVAACSPAAVPMPSDDASPEQVVRAYADAVHGGDCTVAGALVAEPSQSWCGTVDITTLAVTRTTRERMPTQQGSGRMGQRIWVELTTEGSDPSMPDGEHLWSYLVDRTGPHGAWRIVDQGTG